MEIGELIDRYAKYYGSKVAVVFENKRLSFEEVNQRANKLSNSLLELGIKKGDRVASLNRNCSQHIEIMLARYKIGAVDVTLNPRLSATEIAWQVNDSEAETLIIEEDQISKIVSIRSELKRVKNIIAISSTTEDMLDYETFLEQGSTVKPNVTTTDDELGRIIYTAGTTGRPKGIFLARRSDLSITRNLLLDMIPHLNCHDIFLGLQPLYHAVFTFVLPCWIRGATHVIVREFRGEAAFPVIQQEKVTVIKTVPTVLIRLIDHPDLIKYDLSSVHTIIYGASPMPVERLKQGMKIFGPVFIQNYGLSEAPMTVCTLRRDEHILEGKHEEVARLASVGRPYTFVEVRVVDEGGRDVAPGETGEIIVRGDHIMTAYWKRPEETAETLRDGWVHTRDMGKMDREGYFFLVDRKSEMIISGGLNVYPGEVEQVLYRHPAVQEVAVFGVPDEKWGEAVKAVVVIKPNMVVTEDELKDFCKAHLASYKKPQSVDFVDNLPKSPEGKVLRRELRDPYWKGLERRVH
jgi:long-chain acyl-CoA synthetase